MNGHMTPDLTTRGTPATLMIDVVAEAVVAEDDLERHGLLPAAVLVLEHAV